MRTSSSLFAVSAIVTLILSGCAGNGGPESPEPDQPVEPVEPAAVATAGVEEPAGSLTLAEAITAPVSWEMVELGRLDGSADVLGIYPMDDMAVVMSRHSAGSDVGPDGERVPCVNAAYVVDVETFEYTKTCVPVTRSIVAFDGRVWAITDDEQMYVFDPANGSVSEPSLPAQIAAARDAREANRGTRIELVEAGGTVFYREGTTLWELTGSDLDAVGAQYSVAEHIDVPTSAFAYGAGDHVLMQQPYGATVVVHAATGATTVIDGAERYGGAAPIAHRVAGAYDGGIYYPGDYEDIYRIDPADATFGIAHSVGVSREAANRQTNIVGGQTSIGNTNPTSGFDLQDNVAVVAGNHSDIGLINLDTGDQYIYNIGPSATRSVVIVGDTVWTWIGSSGFVRVLQFTELGLVGADADADDAAPPADSEAYRDGFDIGYTEGRHDAEFGSHDYADGRRMYPRESEDFYQGYDDGYSKGRWNGAGQSQDGGGQSQDGADQSPTGSSDTSSTDDDDECPPGHSLLECFG